MHRKIFSITIAAVLILVLLTLSGCTSSLKTSDSSSLASSSTEGSESSSEASAQTESTELNAGTYTATIDGKEISLSGAYIVDGIDAVINGGTYESTTNDQNVFLVVNGGSLTITGATINKSGEATQSDSQRTSDVSDNYNFYGINSVILVVGEGSSATINDCAVTSSSSGSNAVFATNGGTVTINKIDITTSGNSSRGLDATYEGVINASDITITTSGAHCAPIATDRGGGTITITGSSTLNASGDGSPCIYSTGDITVTGAVGTATGSQAVVIEGKNSVTLIDCELTGEGNNGVMMYQSMSGDAADSDAAASCSTLTLTNTTINNKSDGPMFYITNTTATINIEGSALNNSGGELITAYAGNWGTDGKNGGTLTLNAVNQTLKGSISADSISSVEMNLTESSSFTGTTNGSSVNIIADSTSTKSIG